jgi:hypothetical protein
MDMCIIEKPKVRPEEEVDADERGSYMLRSKVERVIKEMGDKKATEDDDVLTLFGDGLRIVTQVLSNIHET